MMKRIAMNRSAALVITSLLTAGLTPAWGQGEMNHKPMATTANAEMKEMSGMQQPMNHSINHGGNGMVSGAMQGGSAPADARDPHAYSDGYDFGPIPRPRLADEQSFASLLVDRLEMVRNDDNTTGAYDLQAWYGRDYNRVVLKAEGDLSGGKLEEADTELLWGHAVATFWDTQLGLRYESREEQPDRSWLAFGFQGLAPYWFEVDVTAYLGENGRSALGLAAEYELLFTQKLILQPRLEANFYGKKDPDRTRGTGLSDITAGLRLRYEIRREFAPYLGIEWAGRFGNTADYARAAGESKDETRVVLGLRFWL